MCSMYRCPNLGILSPAQVAICPLYFVCYDCAVLFWFLHMTLFVLVYTECPVFVFVFVFVFVCVCVCVCLCVCVCVLQLPIVSSL